MYAPGERDISGILLAAGIDRGTKGITDSLKQLQATRQASRDADSTMDFLLMLHPDAIPKGDDGNPVAFLDKFHKGGVNAKQQAIGMIASQVLGPVQKAQLDETKARTAAIPVSSAESQARAAAALAAANANTANQPSEQKLNEARAKNLDAETARANTKGAGFTPPADERAYWEGKGFSWQTLGTGSGAYVQTDKAGKYTPNTRLFDPDGREVGFTDAGGKPHLDQTVAVEIRGGLQELRNARTGQVKEKAGDAPAAAPAGYRTPNDVKAAVTAGKLSRAEGIAILQKQFGLK